MKRKDWNLSNILYKKDMKIYIYSMVGFNTLGNKSKMAYKEKMYQILKKKIKRKLLRKKEINDFI
jgi:hypothetical protein